MASPRHPMVLHNIPLHAVGGARHVMGGMANPAATATALHGTTPRYVMATPTAPRLGLGLGFGSGCHSMPWRSVEGSVVCRGRFCCRSCHTARLSREKGQNCTSPGLGYQKSNMRGFESHLVPGYLYCNTRVHTPYESMLLLL